MKKLFIRIVSITGLLSYACISLAFTQPSIYSGMYVKTSDCHITYSIDKGNTWASMLNQQCGSGWGGGLAVSSSGVMYIPTGATGAGAVIYTTDGVTWVPMTVTWPTTDKGDEALTVFAFNNTLYVGTRKGYILYTKNNGASWSTANTPSQLDNNAITSLFVSANGTIYAGTDAGAVFSSADNGATWASQGFPDSSSVLGLGVTTNGTVYAVTLYTQAALPPYYFNGSTWVSMRALPGRFVSAYSVFAVDSTVYVGTDRGQIHYTTDNGASWGTLPTKPGGSAIESLYMNQSTLSSIFVQTAGVIRVNGAAQEVRVKNLGSVTVTGVHAQLPADWSDVIQDATDCSSSLPPQGTCVLSFTSTGPHVPQALDVVGEGASGAIFRMALAFSMNGYLVYNVDTLHAYVVDNSNVLINCWNPNFNEHYIPGITDADTTAGGSACNGATDGHCNTQQIVRHSTPPYHDYAAGLCYQSTSGGASPGDWYLPSICELAAGLYSNTPSGSPVIASCAPVNTGIFSLYGLGLLTPTLAAGNYWSSTEFKRPNVSSNSVWIQSFSPGGGGFQQGDGLLDAYTQVICARALPI